MNVYKIEYEVNTRPGEFFEMNCIAKNIIDAVRYLLQYEKTGCLEAEAKDVYICKIECVARDCIAANSNNADE